MYTVARKEEEEERGEGTGEGVRNNRVSESAASVLTNPAALRFLRSSPCHSSLVPSLSTS